MLFFFPLFSSQKRVSLFHEDLFSLQGEISQGMVPSHTACRVADFSLKDRYRVGKLLKIMPGNNV